MQNPSIKMKKATKFSNPARNQVLASNADSSLTLYLREISQIKPLTSSEEKRVAKLANEGNVEARKKLIQSNLKLVVTIARKAIHMSDLPMIDLIQEGNLGLMIAVEKFNWKFGYKFSTYASWWIRQSMFKAISEQGHCMKVPVYIQETLSKFSKVKAEMEKKYNCQVKTADVAKKMEIAPDKIDTYLSAFSKAISIEGGIEGENGKEMSVADILIDEKSSVEANADYICLQKDLQTVISTLKEREQEVVKMRFGLCEIGKRTLEEIGNLYGVTKECVRQTELRALKKMRASSFGQDVLSCYIG